MSRLNIDIDPQTHAILKEKAKLDERSLTQYVKRILREHAGTLTSPAQPQIPTQPQEIRRKIIIGGE